MFDLSVQFKNVDTCLSKLVACALPSISFSYRRQAERIEAVFGWKFQKACQPDIPLALSFSIPGNFNRFALSSNSASSIPIIDLRVREASPMQGYRSCIRKGEVRQTEAGSGPARKRVNETALQLRGG